MPDVVVIDVGGRKLAVPTTHAREVTAAGWVTPVPTSKPPVAGVTQLRGQILPVLDVVGPRRGARRRRALRSSAQMMERAS
jgi:chemotaxis signal transduction protein